MNVRESYSHAIEQGTLLADQRVVRRGSRQLDHTQGGGRVPQQVLHVQPHRGGCKFYTEDVLSGFLNF